MLFPFISLLALSVAFLSWSAKAEERIFVSPAGAGAGVGTSDRPFVLAEGREYEFNRLVQAASSKGDVKIIMRSGLYQGVRLQIIKEGIDSDWLYLPRPAHGLDPMRFEYENSSRCNSDKTNCRVISKDFMLTAHNNSQIAIVAEENGKVILDGTDFSNANPEIESTGITIAGAYFGVKKQQKRNLESQPIKNILIRGVVVRGYKNGIVVTFARGVTIENCRVENIGSHSLAKRNDLNIGVSGFSANGSSELVLVRDCLFSNMWNQRGLTPTGRVWPDLMHCVYDGDSRDIVFLRNKFVGSSGPMIKFGYYPTIQDNRIINEFGERVSDRRGFFIQNEFILRGGSASRKKSFFIHENSRIAVGLSESGPAKGMLFYGNKFDSDFNSSSGDKTYLLRQELPAETDQPSLPGFIFWSNVSNCLKEDTLLAVRHRGSPYEQIDSVPPAELPNNIAEFFHKEAEKSHVSIPVGLSSDNDAEDQTVEDILNGGDMPRT